MEIIMGSSNWSVVIRNEYISKKHWHNNIEIVHVLSGSLLINIDNKIHEIGDGETFIISRGTVHYYIEPDGQSILCIIKLPLDFMPVFSKEMTEYYMKFYQDVIHVEKNKIVQEIFDRIKEMEHKKIIIQESILIAQIICLTILLSENPKLIKNRTKAKANNDSDVMEKMISYLEDHLNEKITLAEISAYLGFSESYCSKYIKKKSNMNFLEYLNNARIQRAELELRSTDTSITEIAYMTGFTSIQSFNRIFKSLCGVSPTDYRKRLRDKK